MHLNGFKISLTSDTFSARLRDLPDGEDVHEFRQKHGEQWFFHWNGGVLYALHKTHAREAVQKMSEAQELDTNDHLPLLAARLVNALPAVLKDCKPYEYRPWLWSGVRC